MFHPKGPTFFELARQALSSTERGYDLLAPKFDYTPFRTPDAVIEAVVARIGRPVASGIDLCCGTGTALPFLRRYCRERIVGVDLSEGMLAQARQRMAGSRGARVELTRADVLDLPFESELDVATCFGAFGHIRRQDEPRFASSIAKVLKPGGRFLFATAELPPLWSPARLLSHGFNAAMRLRNALFPGEFVMYYLTFTLPEVRALFERHGFAVEVHDAGLEPPLAALKVVVATRIG